MRVAVEKGTSYLKEVQSGYTYNEKDVQFLRRVHSTPKLYGTLKRYIFLEEVIYYLKEVTRP